MPKLHSAAVITKEGQPGIALFMLDEETDALSFLKSFGDWSVALICRYADFLTRYLCSDKAAQDGNEDSPGSAADKLAQALADEVMPIGRDCELLSIGDTVFGAASMARHSWSRRVFQRIKNLFYLIFGSRDQTMAIKLANHLSLDGHSLHWHVFEAGGEIVGFVVVPSYLKEEPA